MSEQFRPRFRRGKKKVKSKESELTQCFQFGLGSEKILMSEVLGHHRQRRQTNRHPFYLQNVEKIQEEKNSVRLFLNLQNITLSLWNSIPLLLGRNWQKFYSWAANNNLHKNTDGVTV